MVESFLTDKQKKILKLREEGKTQEEVSEIIGTSRSNVSLIEKRARKNINKSRETIQEWKTIVSPINVEVEEGVDVFEVPKMVYKKADEEDVKVDLATVDIIGEIEEAGGDLLEHRVTKDSFVIYITESGEVLIEEDDSF